MSKTNHTAESIKALREEKSLTQQDLADILGISRELISKMEGGIKTVSRYTNLLLNEYIKHGKVVSKEVAEGTKSAEDTKGTEGLSKEQSPFSKAIKRVPFYDAPADAGNVDGDMLPVSEPTGYIDTGDLFGARCEAVIRIRGNSMMAGFPGGSLIGLNRHYDSFIQPGELFVMETRSQRVFKRVYIDEARSGDWECYSDNEELYSNGPRAGKPKYPIFFIPKEEILKIWMVVGCAREEGNSIIIHANPTT